jgi:hypothetical protein
MAQRHRHDLVRGSDRWVFVPLLAAGAALAHALSFMHHGRLNAYIAYALASLVICAAVVYVT